MKKLPPPQKKPKKLFTTVAATENATLVFWKKGALCWFQLVLFGFLSFHLRPGTSMNVLIPNKQTNDHHMSQHFWFNKIS